MPFEPERVELKERGPAKPYDFELITPLTYSSPGSDPVTVPASFQTDLASVPHILTWYVPRYGLYTKAAIVHDHLCQELPPEMRFEADRHFRNGMAELRVPWLRRWLMWAAVTWATILEILTRRIVPTLVATVAVAILGVIIVTGQFGVWTATALIAVTTLSFVLLICLRASDYPDLMGVILRCYLASIPGSLILVVSLPLLVVKALSSLVDLIVDGERARLGFSLWIKPLLLVLKASLQDQLRRLFRRAREASPLWVEFDSGTARERRLRQLLSPPAGS
jgi:hypothetical protein